MNLQRNPRRLTAKSLLLSTIVDNSPTRTPDKIFVTDFEEHSLTNHRQRLVQLLENVESADLRIVCSNGVELTAHKIILSTHNPVFASMVTSKMIEGITGLLQVKDVGSPVMKLVLHYLYTSELKEAWRDPENIVEFTYAAGKYQLTEVLKFLNNVLGTFDHGEENLLALLNLAEKLDLKKAENLLLEKAKQSIVQVDSCKNFKEVLKSFHEQLNETQ